MNTADNPNPINQNPPVEGHRDIERIYTYKRFCQGLDASASENLLAIGCGDRKCYITNPYTGELIYSLKGHDFPIRGCSFSKYTIATGSSDETVKEWDTHTGKLISSFEGKLDAEVISVSHSRPLEEWLAATTEKGDIAIFDWEHSSTPSHILNPHRGRVTSIDWSRNNVEYIVSCGDGSILIYDKRKMPKPLGGIYSHKECVFTVRYTNAGDLIASASYDGTAAIWRRSNGKCLFASELHEGKVSGIDFDPTDTYLASVGWDGRVILYKRGAETFTPLKEFEMRHARAATKVKFARNGSWLVSVSEDGQAIVWKNHFACPSLYHIGSQFVRENLDKFSRKDIDENLPPLLVEEQIPALIPKKSFFGISLNCFKYNRSSGSGDDC